jgi:4-hydroxybenzoate polyprenyltransferase
LRVRISNLRVDNSASAASRWWVYQRERFPLIAHGLLIAAFSSSAIAFSAMLRGQMHFPPLALLLAGFISSLTIFIQLRVADEFKDFEDDSKFRPYRPVQRGLIRLSELRGLAVVCAVIQVVVAIAVDVRLLALLVLVWAYLGLMTTEFFVPAWLKRHPVIYMLSHMAIMPIIDLYVSGFDWVPAHTSPPQALIWFLFVSFCNGIVVEIGRKIRAPGDEERGVETYTILWGRTVAVTMWLVAIAATAAFAFGAAAAIGQLPAEIVVLGIVMAAALACAIWFLVAPVTLRAKIIEILSGVWTLVMYLGLGAVPMLVRSFQ